MSNRSQMGCSKPIRSIPLRDSTAQCAICSPLGGGIVRSARHSCAAAMLQTMLRLLIPLCLLTALMAAGAIFAGQTNPELDEKYWSDFGFDACAMPCFAGITPGQTLFTDATALIARYIPTLNEQILISSTQAIFFAEAEDAPDRLTGIARYAQGKVGEISLTLARPLFSVLLRFGRPDCALAYPTGNAEYLYLYWEDGALRYWASVAVADSVHFNSPVFTINSSSEERSICSTNTDTRSWRGFAPVWVYGNT